MVVATSFRTLAIVGMSVNGAFLGICGWRVVETLRVMTALIENRVRLHLTLLMFAFCEFIYQVSLFLANG